jgi:hypothetical protein
MITKDLREAIDTYKELLLVHQLNVELLDTLELTLISIRSYCTENNIPIGNSKISSLLSKVNILLEEIDCSVSDGFSQRKPSVKDFTEPRYIPFKL